MSATQYLFYQSSHSFNFWNEIITSLFGAEIDNDDAMILRELKNGHSWLSYIPTDWQVIYGHLYDHLILLNLEKGNILSEYEIHKIDKDLYRTFSVFVQDTKIGKIGLKLVETHFCSSLRQLLLLLTYHMGYTQGMNYLVAVILLIEPNSVKNCYLILTYLLFHQHLSLLFVSSRATSPSISSPSSSVPSAPSSDPSFPSASSSPTSSASSCLSQFIKIYDKKFQLFYPILHFHLQENDFFCYCYAVDWFTTCFIRSSPGELSLHILELLLLGMKDILIRIGLSIMHLLHDTLLKLEDDDVHVNFRSLVKQLNAKEVITMAVKINLNRKKKPDVEENILQVLISSPPLPPSFS
jgi:hypothetical protein